MNGHTLKVLSQGKQKLKNSNNKAKNANMAPHASILAQLQIARHFDWLKVNKSRLTVFLLTREICVC